MRTGATKEQIEAAVRSGLEWEIDPATLQKIRERSRMSIDEAAHLLVPPTHRIIALDDLKELWAGYQPAEDTDLGDEADFGLRIRTLIAAPDGEQETEP